MKRFRGGIILRLFLSYFSILVIVWISNTILTQLLLNTMRKDAKESIAYQVNLLSESINREYINYIDNSYQIAFSSEMMKHKMIESESLAAYGIGLLEKVTEYNRELYSVYVSYGTGKIYSSRGMSWDIVFFERKLNCTEESIQKGMDYLDVSSNKIFCLYTQTGMAI